ncbi:MAG: efflux RND transporter permease subunit [archaeon]
MNIKKFFTWRVWLLLIFIVLAIIAINPTPNAQGIEVRSVPTGSDIAEQGLSSGETLISINGQSINTLQDYQDAILTFEYESQEVQVKTTEEDIEYTVTNDLDIFLDENLTILDSKELTPLSTLLEINGKEIETYEQYQEIENELIPKQTIKITTNKGEYAYLSRETPEFTVQEASSSNLLLGLDLQGGTRVLLQPVSDEEITDADIEDLIKVLENRLNVYGLSDIKIRTAEDWAGNRFVLIELAGTTESEVQELISQQGFFEAKVGNESVFIGGKEDIPYVCRDDGSCSGIRTCNPSGNQWVCDFSFSITLSQEAAERQAAATENLEVEYDESGGAFLSETLDLYLDDELVDSLRISEDLKGQATTQISISGPGYGTSKAEAVEDAAKNMDQLQTILITGSLPFDIEIAQMNTVSPIMGESFVKNVFWVGLFALLAVALVVFIRYRAWKVVIPMIATGVAEILLILGFAAAVGWNLDMAAIAGIIAAVGTGVDDQIVIVDEAMKGVKEKSGNWKARLKTAFFIIFAAYATTVAAMLPLWNAGAGLIRGFALTTIVGVTIGVLLTRPAFAHIVEKLYEED